MAKLQLTDVEIYVKDLKAARAFYTKKIGLKVRSSMPKWGYLALGATKGGDDAALTPRVRDGRIARLEEDRRVLPQGAGHAQATGGKRRGRLRLLPAVAESHRDHPLHAEEGHVRQPRGLRRGHGPHRRGDRDRLHHKRRLSVAGAADGERRPIQGESRSSGLGRHPGAG